MRTRNTLIASITLASVCAGAGIAFSQAPVSPGGKPTTAGKPTISPGQGKATPSGGAKASPKACTNGRKAPTVAYVFRGQATTSDATSVTIDLDGANAHGRRLLASSTPSVVISPTASTDRLIATVEASTEVTRGGGAATTSSILVGDVVKLNYRGVFIPKGWTCTGTTAPTVVAASSPLSLTGLSLKRITAQSPTPA